MGRMGKGSLIRSKTIGGEPGVCETAERGLAGTANFNRSIQTALVKVARFAEGLRDTADFYGCRKGHSVTN